MLALNSKSARFLATNLVLHQPLGSRSQRRFTGDDHPRSTHLGSSLFAVTPVSQKHVAVFADCKHTGCPRKPAKVSNIGKMGDQQDIQRVAFKNALQLLQTAPVVHSESLTSESKKRPAAPRTASESIPLSQKLSSRPEPQRQRRWSGGTWCPGRCQEKARCPRSRGFRDSRSLRACQPGLRRK